MTGSKRIQYPFILMALLVLAGCSSTPGKPETMQVLPACGLLPNCVNTQSGRGIQGGEPIRANAAQWAQLKSWIARQGDWQIIIDDDSFMQAVVTTSAMKFQDDVQLLFVARDGHIQVRSSSRYGISDMGANARRIETLRDQLAR
jgi:uncharacterized protein (DUF1499 family)